MILSASDGACNSKTYGLSNSKLTSSRIFDFINKHMPSSVHPHYTPKRLNQSMKFFSSYHPETKFKMAVWISGYWTGAKSAKNTIPLYKHYPQSEMKGISLMVNEISPAKERTHPRKKQTLYASSILMGGIINTQVWLHLSLLSTA
jgi:hypothetical protein